MEVCLTSVFGRLQCSDRPVLQRPRVAKYDGCSFSLPFERIELESRPPRSSDAVLSRMVLLLCLILRLLLSLASALMVASGSATLVST